MLSQWIVFLLYGISGTLFAYALSLMVDSALGAFAIVACYQFITFVVSTPVTCVEGYI